MKPTAAPAHFPYREHRNMAEVMRDEAYPNLTPLNVSCDQCGAIPSYVCRYPAGGECPPHLVRKQKLERFKADLLMTQGRAA